MPSVTLRNDLLKLVFVLNGRLSAMPMRQRQWFILPKMRLSKTLLRKPLRVPKMMRWRLSHPHRVAGEQGGGVV
jgi:hypothetical protein